MDKGKHPLKHRTFGGKEEGQESLDIGTKLLYTSPTTVIKEDGISRVLLRGTYMDEMKKEWEMPELVVYGDIDALTQSAPNIKPKQVGSRDDFGVVGISDP
jgi:hypothetical protein